MNKLIFLILFNIFSKNLKNITVIYYPGMNSKCKNFKLILNRLHNLKKYNISCIDYGNDTNTYLPQLWEKACNELKKIRKQLLGGWMAFGESQGGLIAKMTIQHCDEGRYAKGLVTLSSPLMGISSIPKYKKNSFINYAIHICEINFFKKYMTPCNYYWKIGDTKFNKNSMIGEFNNLKFINRKYKNRIKNLDRLMLIINRDDNTVIPKQSGHLGFIYKSNSKEILINYEDSKYYKNDNLGIKYLNKRGKLFKCIFNGNHTDYEPYEFYNIIVPFLNYNKKLKNSNLDDFEDKCEFNSF